MMIIPVRLFATILFGIILNAYTVFGLDWEQLNGPEGGKMGRFIVKDGKLIVQSYVYGALSTYYCSSDSGVTWHDIGRVPARNSGIFHGFGMTDKCILISSFAGTFRSTDHGATWTTMIINNERPDMVVSFITFGDILFAAQYARLDGIGIMDSVIYRSADNGGTWYQSTIPMKTDLDKALTTNNALLLYSSDRIVVSKDTGKTWTMMQTPSQYLQFIASIDNRLIAATNSGIYLSDDEGHEWRASNDGLPSNPADVYQLKLSGNDVYAKILYSVLCRSTDKGLTWHTVNTPVNDIGTDWLYTMAADNERMIFYSDIRDSIQGWKGAAIFTSTDRGASWDTLYLHGKPTAPSTVAVLGNYFFYCDGDGVYRSANEGLTFTKSSSGIFATDITCIEKSGNELFASTSIRLFRSTDNGNSWTAICSDPEYPFDPPLYTVKRISDTLYASGRSEFCRSSDNGATWQRIDKNCDLPYEYHPIVSIGEKMYYYACSFTNDMVEWQSIDTSSQVSFISDYMTNNSIHYIAGENGIARSTDDGNTWTKVVRQKTNCLSAYGDTLYAGLDDNCIIFSNDNGLSWSRYESEPPVLPFETACAHFDRNSAITSLAAFKNHLFITYDVNYFDCASVNAVYSPDHGKTWSSLVSDLPYVVNRFQRFDDELYATTQFGGIWRLNLSGLSTGRQVGSSRDRPGKFTVNMHNRNGDGTGILVLTVPFRECVPFRERVAITLYTLSGEKITEIIDQPLLPGTYSFMLSRDNFTKGCYIVVVKAGKSLTTERIYLLR